MSSLPWDGELGDLLKAVKRREQGGAGSALLNSLRELLGVDERIRHNLRPAPGEIPGSRWVSDTDETDKSKDLEDF